MAELNSDYPLSSEFQVNGKLSQTYAELKQYLLDSMEAEPITVKAMPTETESLQQAMQHLLQKSLHSRLFQERK